jgi:cellulose biosynthesis protein BcsQ
VDRNPVETPAGKLGSILQKISPKELIGLEAQGGSLLYSVIGFIPACDFVENPLLLSNLAYLLANRQLNVLALDFKVFYPNLYHYFNAPPQKKGDGLIKVLKSDKVDPRGEIQPTNIPRVFLLSPSPHDLIEEYYDFELRHIDRLLNTVKTMFDLVLVDVPNNPPLEFCLGALKYCHATFLTATERVEALENMMRLLSHAESVGISPAKAMNVIFMNLQGISFDYQAVAREGFKIVAALPFVKQAAHSYLDGKIYMRDDPLVNKYFRKELEKLAGALAE